MKCPTCSKETPYIYLNRIESGSMQMTGMRADGGAMFRKFDIYCCPVCKEYFYVPIGDTFLAKKIDAVVEC